MVRVFGDGFGVADHARVENDFSRDLGQGAESLARPDASVFEDQDRFQAGRTPFESGPLYIFHWGETILCPYVLESETRPAPLSGELYSFTLTYIYIIISM